MDSCYNDETLLKYLADQIVPKASDAISEHTQRCSVCQNRLDVLSDDAELRILHSNYVMHRAEHDCEEMPQVLLERLIRIPSTTGREENSGHSDITEFHSQQQGSSSANTTEHPRDHTDLENHKSELGTVAQYRLLRVIGQGGMGTVYEALHTKLLKRVAIKMLAAHRKSSEDVIQRFSREMQAAGRLEHPNIVRATDAGEVDGTQYLAMEYVDGIDLASLLKKAGKLSVPDACETIRQAACGLQHAFENDLIHRDLKPSNLMLSKRGCIKILDLGLARLRGDGQENEFLTQTGYITGTAAFMAPEQFDDSQAVGIRSDIYGLGCTLYCLLTNAPPFAEIQHKGVFEIMNAHKTKAPENLNILRSEVPKDLAVVAERMLAKDPAKRYQAPRDVAKALEPFCKDSSLATIALQFTKTDTDQLHADKTARRQPDQLPVALHNTSVGRSDDTDLESEKFAVSLSPGLASGLQPETKLLQRSSEGNSWLKRSQYLIAGAALTLLLSVIGVSAFSRWRIANQPQLDSGTNQSAGAQGSDIDSVISLSRDREVAEWVIGAGGIVTIATSEEQFLDVNNSKNLPDGEMRVCKINLKGTSSILDNNAARLFSTLEDLTYLNLSSVSVTDRSIAALGKGLFSLDYLSLQWTNTSDADMIYFGKMPTLTVLWLDNTQVSDKGLKHLKSLKELEGLGLSYTRVTDQGLHSIEHLSHLHSLNLSHTQITNTGLLQLSQLQNLMSLKLIGTQITDSGLNHLRPLLSLKNLDISETEITDAGIEALTLLSKLESLTLKGARISQSGLQRLRTALPQCAVFDNQ